MSRKHIFIGPSYPPKHIMQAIIGLSINITTRDFITERVDNAAVTARLGNYITNLIVDTDGVHFDVIVTNPITGEIIRTTTDSSSVHVITRPGTKLPSFSGGSTQYGISPCCAVLTYPEDEEDAKDIMITCKTPLKATVSDSSVIIDVDNITNTTPKADDSETPGVLSINGISTKNGGISIKGIGSVSVTVTGSDGGGNNV